MKTAAENRLLLKKAAGFENKRIYIAVTGAAFAVLSLFVVFAFFADSARLLINQLFETSEQLNSYVYDRLSVSEGTSAQPAEIAFGCFAGGAFVFSMFTKSNIPALLLAALLAGLQIYFGVSLPAPVNIVLFAAFACKSAVGNMKNAVVPCVIIVAALSVLLFYPDVDEDTEALSEKARDSLSMLFEQGTLSIGELPETVTETRPENLRSLKNGSETAVAQDRYRLVTREQVEISKPQIRSIIRIILLSLAIPLILVLPFAPFVLLNMRRKKAIEELARLSEGTNSERIIKTFERVNLWLDLFNEGSSEKLYIHRFDDNDLSSDEYFSEYKKAAVIWQEAAYSTHVMTDEQVKTTESLLEQTEKRLYEKGDLLMHLRLKYVYCLCE